MANKSMRNGFSADPREIAIAVVERGGHFLIGRRAPDQTLAGLWEFPGGHVEAGEAAAPAAVRECFEETGLRVSVVREYPERLQVYDHGELRLRFFACRPDSEGAPRSPFRWVSRDQLHDYPFPDGNRPLLAYLVDPRHGSRS